MDYYLDMQVGSYYRGDVRQKFEDEWRYLMGASSLKFIKAERLVQLDPLIKFCPPQPRKRP